MPLNDKDAATVWDHPIHLWNQSTPQADSVLSNVHQTVNQGLETEHLRKVTWSAPLSIWNGSQPSAQAILSNLHQMVHQIADQLSALTEQVTGTRWEPSDGEQ